MDEACATLWRDKKRRVFWRENLKRMGPFEDLGMDMGTI
jgi:hypothetical protein